MAALGIGGSRRVGAAEAFPCKPRVPGSLPSMHWGQRVFARGRKQGPLPPSPPELRAT